MFALEHRNQLTSLKTILSKEKTQSSPRGGVNFIKTIIKKRIVCDPKSLTGWWVDKGCIYTSIFQEISQCNTVVGSACVRRDKGSFTTCSFDAAQILAPRSTFVRSFPPSQGNVPEEISPEFPNKHIWKEKCMF